MAKRNAATELNHDNWEEEDEKEEAGEFKRASEEQMKERVIKKAKRRNLNEDQKKNIFNSFGGFSSTNNVSAADAFSFLAKQPTNGAASANGTENKETKETDKEKVPASADTKEPAAEVKSPLTGFVFGQSSTLPSSSVFGLTASKTEPEPQDVGSKPPDDLFAKFMKKSSGKWTCDVCMISNDADVTACLACGAPKPGCEPSKDSAPKADSFKFGFTASQNEEKNSAVSGLKFGSDSGATGFVFGQNSTAPSSSVFGLTTSKPEPESQPQDTGSKPPDDLFAKFMKKSSGKWTCDVCMISNDADITVCVACGAPKPGCEPAKDPAPKTETKEFKFGFTASKTEEKNSASSTDAKTTGGFQFGSSNGSESKSTGGFQFGSSNSSESRPTGGFQFGSSNGSESKPTGGFQFGSSNGSESTPTGGFQFGTSPAASSGSEPGSIVTTGVKTKPEVESPSKSKKEYLSNLKSLNTQVTSWINTHVDQNPLVDLTPVFKDYEKHIGNLRIKHNITTSASKEATKPVSVAPSPSPFSTTFGSNQTLQTGLKTGFQFGSVETKTSDVETGKVEKEDGEEEEDSPKKPAEPVVEEDAIYSKKCKLFYKKSDSYVDRGIGKLYLKLTAEQKLQLVIRADNSLGNILLNVLVSPSTPMERLGTNNVMMVTVPNPPIDPKTESEPVTFLIRVKTAEDADELKLKLDGLCKN